MHGNKIFLRPAALLLVVLLILLPATSAFALDSPVKEIVTDHVDHDFSFPAEWPAGPNVNASAAVLLEITTGTVLYAKNADVEMYPASVTKIMTGLLTAENADLNDTITYSYDAIYTNLEYGAMTMGISMGEEISVRDTFYGMMLQSANDAANGLAEYLGGTNEGFAAMMNARARSVGAYNTHFSNPSGLYGASHYTTCYDLALIMAEAVKNPVYVAVSSTVKWVIEPTNKYKENRYLYQQHKMRKNSTYEYEGFVCGKTGWIEESGNTLVTYCERGDMKLVAVVMGDTNPAHYVDTVALMDYGFDNFKLCEISDTLLSSVSSSDDILSSSSGIFSSAGFSIQENHDSRIVLPADADESELNCRLDYDVESAEGENLIARIIYTWNDMEVGSGTLEFTKNAVAYEDPLTGETVESTADDVTPPPAAPSEGKAGEIIVTVTQVLIFIGIVAAVVGIVALLIFLSIYFSPKQVRIRNARKRRKNRRNRSSSSSGNVDDFLDLH